MGVGPAACYSMRFTIVLTKTRSSTLRGRFIVYLWPLVIYWAFAVKKPSNIALSASDALGGLTNSQLRKGLRAGNTRLFAFKPVHLL